MVVAGFADALAAFGLAYVVAALAPLISAARSGRALGARPRPLRALGAQTAPPAGASRISGSRRINSRGSIGLGKKCVQPASRQAISSS